MRLFILLLFTIVPMASAQETSGPELGNIPDLISTGYLMQVIGSLALVFGAVVLMAFVVKRFNRSPLSREDSSFRIGFHQRRHPRKSGVAERG